MPRSASMRMTRPMSLMMLGWMPSVGSSRISSFGPGGQRARDRQLLLLPARQVAAAAVEHLLEHREQLEQLGRDRRAAAACRPGPCAGSPPPSGGRRSRAPAARSRCPGAHARSGVGLVMRRPSSAMLPVFTGTTPIRLFSSVVLPTPLRPSTTVTSPSFGLEGDVAQDVRAAVVLVEAVDAEHVPLPRSSCWSPLPGGGSGSRVLHRRCISGYRPR